MKAIIYRNYGSPDVLKCEEIEKPTPGDDEVLIRVRAASLNPLDYHLMKGGPYIVRILLGLLGPKIKRPGRDVAGQVEAVGRNVIQFKLGDEVFGTCRGALAKYVCTSESALVMKPDNVTFEQAASVPVAALTALQSLRDKGQIHHSVSGNINIHNMSGRGASTGEHRRRRTTPPSRRPTAKARRPYRKARNRTSIVLFRLCSSINATTAKRRSRAETKRSLPDSLGLSSDFADVAESQSSRS